MKHIINSLPEAPRFILTANYSSIKSSISESLNNDGVLISKVYFNLSIDLISLIDLHPASQSILFDFPPLVFALKSSLEAILIDSLPEYSIVSPISELMSLSIFLSSFPAFLLTEQSVNSLLNDPIRFPSPFASRTPLLGVVGTVIPIGKAINGYSESYRCTNSACSSKTAIIKNGDIVCSVDANNKRIARVPSGRLKCCQCNSALDRTKTMMEMEYNYVVTVQDDATNYRGYILGTSLFDGRSTVSVGYLERTGTGRVLFKCLATAVSSRLTTYVVQLEEEMENIKCSGTPYTKLYRCGSLLLGREPSAEDLALITIANMFNVTINNKIYNNEGLVSSPVSMDTPSLSATERPLRISILTDDVNYAVSVLKTVTDVPIIYSKHQVTKPSLTSTRCIFISSSMKKEKSGCIKRGSSKYIREFMDIEFIVKADGIPDYDYVQVKRPVLNWKVSLDDELIKEVFAREREVFKGIVRPDRLLRTVECLYMSLKALTGDKKCIFLIPECFEQFISIIT